MQKQKTDLVVLPGCVGCTKVCNWKGMTADKVRAEGSGNEPYGCNSGNQS